MCSVVFKLNCKVIVGVFLCSFCSHVVLDTPRETCCNKIPLRQWYFLNSLESSNTCIHNTLSLLSHKQISCTCLFVLLRRCHERLKFSRPSPMPSFSILNILDDAQNVRVSWMNIGCLSRLSNSMIQVNSKRIKIMEQTD